MTTSENTQPTAHESADVAVLTDVTVFTHLTDCLCPTCFHPAVPGVPERPDFRSARKQAVDRAEGHTAALATTLDADDLHRSATRTANVRSRRLSRYQACEKVWDFPDHFVVTTSREPGVRGSGLGRSLVTLLDVLDEHGRVVASVNSRMHCAGDVVDGRAVTDLDDLRVDPTDPDSPVVVGALREWFDVDQTTVATTE